MFAFVVAQRWPPEFSVDRIGVSGKRYTFDYARTARRAGRARNGVGRLDAPSESGMENFVRILLQRRGF